jgi:hypothetical protein
MAPCAPIFEHRHLNFHSFTLHLLLGHRRQATHRLVLTSNSRCPANVNDGTTQCSLDPLIQRYRLLESSLYIPRQSHSFPIILISHSVWFCLFQHSAPSRTGQNVYTAGSDTAATSTSHCLHGRWPSACHRRTRLWKFVYGKAFASSL